MRIYLELYEIASEGSAEEPDFVRIDVTEWDKDNVDEAVRLLQQHARESYASYTLQFHYCRHDANQPCTAVVLEAK